MALYHFSAKVLSRSFRNTVGALAYRAGCKLYDEKIGLSFDYRSKSVEHVELLLPKDAPEWDVYGLAPTGKAAQNLEQSGISTMTLHRFLRSFEEGRCPYNSNSVLVLDEAGMADMERFEKLLGAGKQLGVKLIVVEDGAQLQPVEAGPAFRLVTQRLGKSELNTVLRQKEEW